jgi:hypothetical protein
MESFQFVTDEITGISTKVFKIWKDLFLTYSASMKVKGDNYNTQYAQQYFVLWISCLRWKRRWHKAAALINS